MYLNFILTALCLLLLVFLACGFILFKKFRKIASKNPQIINPKALDQTKIIMDSMRQMGDIMNFLPKK